MSDKNPGGGKPDRPETEEKDTGRDRPKPAEEGPVGDDALNEDAERDDDGVDRSGTPGRTFDV